MTSNLKRYENDLEKLIEKGKSLYLSIRKECGLEDNELSNKDISSNFKEEYQEWYSEALTIIKQIIPDREEDFVKIYKQHPESYTLADYLTGVQKSIKVGHFRLAPSLFQQQLGILKSVQKRFESSLFDMRQSLQINLFDSELETATELNKKGFARGAGAVAGVVLEGHLKEVCSNHKIASIKDNSTINDLNDRLKNSEVIDTPMWRKIQYLADLRNLCSHKTESEPTKEKVNELIEGVKGVIKILF